MQVPYSETLVTNPVGAAGITINADYSFTILTTYEDRGQSSYEVKYTALNRDTPEASIVSNEFTITITYEDLCNDPTMNSLTPFAVSNMQTSVLRVNTEHPSEQALPDVSQQITGNAEVLLYINDSTKWNTGICGDLSTGSADLLIELTEKDELVGGSLTFDFNTRTISV